MFTYRITLFFRSAFAGGWTESWYRVTPASASEVMQTVLIGGGLFQSRRVFLASSYGIAFVRVSNVDVPRDGLVFASPGGTGDGLAPGAAGSQEQIFDAVNVRFYAGPQRWRSLLFRGLSQNTFVGNIIDPNAPIIAGMPAYTQVLRNGYSLQRWDDDVSTRLLSITVDFGLLTSFLGENALAGLVPGGLVKIAGSRGVSFLNRRYKVKSVSTAQIFPANARTNTYGSLSAVTPGRIVRLVASYPVITTAAIVGPASRRTGRPSYLPRGARPARRP